MLFLYRTEEAVKANKIAMIESVFDVKRQALRALSSIKQQYTAIMSSFFNASIENLNTALTAAQNGMSGKIAICSPNFAQVEK